MVADDYFYTRPRFVTSRKKLCYWSTSTSIFMNCDLQCYIL